MGLKNHCPCHQHLGKFISNHSLRRCVTLKPKFVARCDTYPIGSMGLVYLPKLAIKSTKCSPMGILGGEMIQFDLYCVLMDPNCSKECQPGDQ